VWKKNLAHYRRKGRIQEAVWGGESCKIAPIGKAKWLHLYHCLILPDGRRKGLRKEVKGISGMFLRCVARKFMRLGAFLLGAKT